MKKLICLIAFFAVITFGFKLKNEYDRYKLTHLSADTVVYYVPGHIYLHTDRDCPNLYGGWGQTAKQDTYGRMKNSKMTDELCPYCVPPQYIN